jgi:putative heme-binding domain-containing protein
VQLLDPKSPAARERVVALAEDPDARVRFEVALALGDFGAPIDALASICRRDAGDPWISAAILSSSAKRSGELFAALALDGHGPPPFQMSGLLEQLESIVGVRNQADEVALLRPPETGVRTDLYFGYGEGMKRAGRSLREAASGKEFYIALLNAAHGTALDKKAPLPQRQRSVEFLAFDDFDHTHEALATLLLPSQPQPLQAAAVQALASFNRPEVATILLERWPTFTAGTRTGAITALLSPKPRLLLLLKAIESGRIPAHEVPFARRAALLRTADPELEPRVAKLFGDDAASSRASVIEKYRPALALEGDPARGEKIYQANCMVCHRHGRQGSDVGPNLASIRQWSPEQVLVNVLDPNREVAPNFIQYSLETTNGNVALGLIGDESPASLTLKSADGTSHTFLRSEIKSLTSLNISLMPEGLEANIPVAALADLIAFVLSDPK